MVELHPHKMMRRSSILRVPTSHLFGSFRRAISPASRFVRYTPPGACRPASFLSFFLAALKGGYLIKVGGYVIVTTYHTSDGVTIHINDECAVSRESVEGKRIIVEQSRIVKRILRNYLEKGLEHESESVGN